LDRERLTHWMRETIPGFVGPLSIAKFPGGQSNPTYKVMTPTRSYVLRKKPTGRLVKGAHDIEREARVIGAVGPTGYPVPRIYAVCAADSVIGSPFYLMEMLEGRIYWDATIPNVDRSERASYFDAMNAAIADLHGLNYQKAGLNDFGKPGNYFERQIHRWSRQYLEDAETGRDVNMDRLLEWLPGNIPAQDECCLVHGDFRIDNIVFHPTSPAVMGVLDWELSTLGNPLADFANHAMMYDMPPNIVAGLAGADLAALGIPTQQEYIASYCRRTGRDGIENMHFYMAFGFFRLAAIFHGIKGRVLRGTASSAHAHERATHFPQLAKIAWLRTTDRSI
jgi:aminoglycoside phosphotransferase (APT) family kinase protein